MKKILALFVLITFFSSIGCATGKWERVGKAGATGALTGAAVGAAAGAAVYEKDRGKGAIVGGVAGALIGTLIGVSIAQARKAAAKEAAATKKRVVFINKKENKKVQADFVSTSYKKTKKANKKKQKVAKVRVRSWEDGKLAKDSYEYVPIN